MHLIFLYSIHAV